MNHDVDDVLIFAKCLMKLSTLDIEMISYLEPAATIGRAWSAKWCGGNVSIRFLLRITLLCRKNHSQYGNVMSCLQHVVSSSKQNVDFHWRWAICNMRSAQQQRACSAHKRNRADKYRQIFSLLYHALDTEMIHWWWWARVEFPHDLRFEIWEQRNIFSDRIAHSHRTRSSWTFDMHVGVSFRTTWSSVGSK